MRRTIITALVLLFGFVGLASAEEYDQEQVVEVMRNNRVLMGEITEAAAEENWFLSAVKLFELAEGMMGILPFEPPRGEEEHWEETLTDFINTAFIGIGACGARDAETLQASIGALWQLNGEGHSEHKPAQR